MARNQINRRRLDAKEDTIVGEISGGKASLSTTLGQITNTEFKFTVDDKLRQDVAPPAAIKIEKLPKHGKMMITQHDGSVRQLAVGDIVST